MQTTQQISEVQLDELIDAVFLAGNPLVKEAYSDFDTAPRSFRTSDSLRKDIDCSADQKRRFFHYAIYYPEAKGLVLEKRIDLKPGAVKGHTHRFSQEGWGLIHLQIKHKQGGGIECCVLANSEARANNWTDTLARLGSPDLWDWQVVKFHAGRLTRLVRKLSKTAQPGAASNAV